jgi:nucleolar pre-ribosomal-associated protein 2
LSLRLALEEVAHDAKNISVPARKQEKVEKASKKRKRSGETVSNPILIESTALPKLLGCIYAAVGYITDASNILSATAVMGIKNARGPVFSAEYMQTVIRTPAEEAAKILGAWMDLCDTTLQSEVEGLSMANWLAPFIEIWSPQPVDPTAYLHFSLHCTRPILSLLCGFKGGKYPTLDWTIQLEQLIARNVINPAKSEFAQDPESLLLSTLTTTSVLQDLSNAPRLFEIAIRSIKPHGSRRRRGSDDAWLLHVFKTLKESLPPKASKDGKVISAMLHLATEHKVLLDLPVLRAITSEFALPQVEVAWELVATMIKLDANVFLIADTESKDNLLDNLLARITEASVAETWPEISQQVVAEVVVPLMNEFAKARDLSSFMRHWYAQIVLFEQLRAESDTEIIAFCAWEDEALHVQLRKLFEASLTIQQIEQLVDWLSSEVNSSPNAVCVLLDAVAGSLVGEAVIDAVGLKLFHMIFDNGTSETLNERYKWRAFRVLSRTIDCTTYTNVDEVLLLWKQASQPFDSYSKDKFLNGLRQTNCQDISQLEIVERFRLICSIWSAPAVGTKDELVKPVLLKSLRSLSSWITDFSSNVVSKVETENEAFDTECNKLVRTRGAITWSLLKCIFIDYPKVLV